AFGSGSGLEPFATAFCPAAPAAGSGASAFCCCFCASLCCSSCSRFWSSCCCFCSCCCITADGADGKSFVDGGCAGDDCATAAVAVSSTMNPKLLLIFKRSSFVPL